MSRRENKTMVKQAEKLYSQGYTYREIASKYEMPLTTLFEAMKRHQTNMLEIKGTLVNGKIKWNQ